MSRRAAAALAVLVLWVAGLGLLAHRELFRPPGDRLAETATRVTPGATFYAVMQGSAHIGYASTTVDTLTDTLRVTDYLVADLPVGGAVQRAEVRTQVLLSRLLRLRSFTFELDAPSGPIRAEGRMDGDSAMTVAIGIERATPDTQRFRVGGPVVLPTLVPLLVALGEAPKVGREYTIPLFDPVAMAPREAALRLEAESLFVIPDSTVWDTASGRWTGALPDTVRAWRIGGAQAAQLAGWVDAQGRMVRSTQLGGMLTLQRMPHEMAFENWRLDSRDRRQQPVTADRDILETTAISASRLVRSSVERLRVRLRGVALGAYQLGGPRQRLDGDTLTVTREAPAALEARFSQVRRASARFPAESGPAPLIESRDREITRLASRLLNQSRVDSAGLRVTSPRRVAEAINRWVHDSLEKRISFGVPSALQVLRTRSGDCNEHTQLYVALARAAGIPARVAAGLVYLDGKFYYHAWPEVFLADWVAVDPTLGQFPADAAHLRFVTGGLEKQVELLQLMGKLQVDVLDAR